MIRPPCRAYSIAAPSAIERSNVLLGAAFAGQPVDRRHARELLERVGLAHRLHHYPAQLSIGEQQRVAIARALIGQPDILILDEPTASLDGETGRGIVAFLREHVLNAQRCIVIVTHDARINEFADRIVSMEDGRVIGVTEGQASA